MAGLVVFGTVAAALLISFPEFFLSLFSRDPALIAVAKKILRIIILIMPFIGVQFIGASFFQAIGKPIPSLILGMSRQYLLLIPLVIILPRFFGIMGIIAAFPIADALSTAITALWLIWEMKKLHLIGQDVVPIGAEAEA